MIWRLAAFYFLLFAYLGVFVPWLPPLLRERGFSDWHIGLALASVQLSRTFLPPLWGLVADRLRARRRFLVGAALFAGLALVALAWPGPESLVFLLLFSHGVFLVPLFPLAETLTLDALGSRTERYGRIRLWGSVGFIATSLGLGAAFQFFGVGNAAVPWVMGGCLILAGLLAGGIRAQPRRSERPGAGQGATRLRWGALAVLCVAAGLGQASHGPYYTFFSLQLAEQGVSRGVIGSLWGWGVVAEVALMAASPLLIARMGLKNAFRAALGLAALRWLWTASGPSLPALAVAQTLHAASFGLLHVTTIQLVDRLTPRAHKALGQSLISALVYGFGIGLGSFLAGRYAGPLGYGGLYIGAAGACAVGLLVSFLPARSD